MRRALALGALGAAALGSAALALGAGGSSYELGAELPNAAGLREGSVVRVGGVSVGVVDSLEISDRDTAIATLAIDGGTAPVGRDAAIRVRPANLIGEKFVDLEVGDRGDPAPSGAPIAADRISTSVELDELLAVLDSSTRARLAIMIREAGIALGGRGAEVAAMLDSLPPALGDADRLLAELTTDNRALGDLLTRSARVMRAVGRERVSLGRLTEIAAAALATLAEHDGGLRQTIRRAPGALRQLRSTLGELDSAAAALRPAAAGLRRVAPPLRAALRAVPGFERAARPALDELRELAPPLRRLGRQGSPVAGKLAEAAGPLATLAGEAKPLTRAVDEATGDLFGLMEAWARSLQSRDGINHMFAVEPVATPELLRVLMPYLTGDEGDTRAQRRRGSADGGGSSSEQPAPGEADPGDRPSSPVGDSELPPLPDPSAADQDATSTRDLLDFLVRP